MFILQIAKVKKQYGARVILDIPELNVYEGDKIAIVGANGAGKTTLMEIISGRLPPDEGQVIRRAELGYLRQNHGQLGSLSGGENLKKHILEETAGHDDIILADEPTAHLDEHGRAWLCQKLRAAKTVLLISHDRALLDEICNRTVELKDGKLTSYAGNYTWYLAQKSIEEERLREKQRRYHEEKDKLLGAIAVRERKMAHQRQKKRRDMAKNSSEARLRGDKRAASMKQQEHIQKVLKNRLDRLEAVEAPRAVPKLRFDFSRTNPPENKILIRCEDLSFSYGRRVIFDRAAFSVPRGAHIHLRGANGCGKSTLLRLIVERHPGMQIAPKLKPGLLTQDFRHIHENATVLQNVKRDAVQSEGELRGILAGLLFPGDTVNRKAGLLSGGEKLRLSLAMLIAGDYNMLLLDEPGNYLDIPSLEAVESILCLYPGALLLVSHDARFAAAVTNTALCIREHAITSPEQGKQSASGGAQKLLLELRRTKLLSDIAAASSPIEKERLEAEYQSLARRIEEC